MTLCFLGERPDEEAPAIGAAVAASAAPVRGLRLGEPAWLGRGSALSVDLEDPTGECTALQARLSAALVALGVFSPEARAFRPHVTVARVPRGVRVARSLPPGPDGPPFDGTALTLFQSRLSPRGASYAPLTRVTL